MKLVFVACPLNSAGFRTDEALCKLSYEASYLDPEYGTLPYTINSNIMSGIAPKQNAFKFKIAPHKQKSIVKKCWQEDEAPLANEALCLSTPKHNGKSDTAPKYAAIKERARTGWLGIRIMCARGLACLPVD